MRREAPEYRHPIRTRFTLGRTDTRVISHSVHCAMHGRAVPLATCIACPKLIAFPARPAAIGAVVTCQSAVGTALPGDDIEKVASRTPVGSIMNGSIVCVLASAGWDSLERLLVDDELEAVPVVDAQGKPIGIVSKTDLLRRTRCGEGEVDTHRGQRIAEPGMHVEHRADISASDVMTPIVHALPEDASVSLAVAALAIEDVAQIPIVSNTGAVVGMLSARDVVAWLAHGLGCIASAPLRRQEALSGPVPSSGARRDP